MHQPFRPSRWIVFAGGLWFILALAIGGSGRLASLRPPAPQLVLAGLTVLLIVLGRAVPDLRSWLQHLDPSVGIALHLTRFIGLYFLVLYRHGQLPYAFAVPGGIGDVVVATLAAGLLLATHGPAWQRAASVWNILGLLDLLFVVVTAARLGLALPQSMAAMLRLPLSLLPTFLVPLLIASHLWLFGRLRVPNEATAGPGRAGVAT